MTTQRWTKRDDLCGDGVLACHYAADHGTLLRRSDGWWASNDCRLRLVGRRPNEELVQPTLGPFSTRSEAEFNYESALGLTRPTSCATSL